MQNLLNEEYLKNCLTTDNGKEVSYRWSHGATDKHLGDGIVVYALVQQLRAKYCVCLGSGGGFIPRIMTQARQDLHFQGIFEGDPTETWGDVGGTWVVDACNEVGGHNSWANEDSFYRTHFYPMFLKCTTKEAFDNYFSLQDFKIDILFIDADHSYSGVKQDFYMYSSLLNPKGIVILHDTDLEYESKFIVPKNQEKDWDRFDGPGTLVRELNYSGEWSCINLFNFGTVPGKPASSGITLVQHSQEYLDNLNFSRESSKLV